MVNNAFVLRSNLLRSKKHVICLQNVRSKLNCDQSFIFLFFFKLYIISILFSVIYTDLESKNGVRITFTSYTADTLFRSRRITNLNQDQPDLNRTINTRIISCTVGNEVIENLPEPVETIFKPLKVSIIVQWVLYLHCKKCGYHGRLYC